MKFLSIIDFFSFSNKIISAIRDLMLAINVGASISTSSLIALISTIIAGLLIGFTSESIRELLFQTIIFITLLVVMGVLASPLNIVMGNIAMQDILIKIRLLSHEFVFIFFVIFFSAILAWKLSSQ